MHARVASFISFFSGLPSLIEVSEDQIVVENGEKFQLDVAVKDIAGNLTSQPRMNVCCKVCCAELSLLP